MNRFALSQFQFRTMALACVFLLPSVVAAKENPLAQYHRWLFLGDSITYDGKYIAFVETVWRLQHPDHSFEIIACGLPSETVSGLSEEGHADGKFPRPDLHERLDRVLDQVKPDVVFVCYGMNDGIYLPLAPDRSEKFQQGIIRARERISKIPAAVYHLTPPVFDALPIQQRVAPADKVSASHPFEGYDDVLNSYAKWLLAQRAQGWNVIDIHGPMIGELNRQRRVDPAFTMAPDGVHPNAAGHEVFGMAVLRGLGYTREEAAELRVPFSEPESVSSQLFKLIHQRQRLLTNAWLTQTGHKRPLAAGLPLAEAQAKAAELESQIQLLLRQSKQ